MWPKTKNCVVCIRNEPYSLARPDGEIIREFGFIVPAGIVELFLCQTDRTHQVRTAEVRPLEVSELENCPPKFGVLKLRAAEGGPLSIYPHEVRSVEFGGTKVGFLEFSEPEDSLLEPGEAKDRLCKIGIFKHGPLQGCPSQSCALELCIDERSVLQLGHIEVGPTKNSTIGLGLQQDRLW